MTGQATLLLGFIGTELPEWLAARLRAGLAGVCLFAENVVSIEQTRALTDAIRAANPRAVIAVDEEGGDVTRLFAATGSPFPGAASLGRSDDVARTADVARSVAGQLRAAGITLNFAPDVDVNSNPRNPVIGVRSFGDDPELVARHAAAWVGAHEAAGVATSFKHFPGHGDTAQDSHLSLPVVDLPLASLRERELLPFAAAIAAGGRTVMTSHILLPQLDATAPATFSSRILGDLLRGELGFEGVIVSDALDMVGASGELGLAGAAVRALAAGCDLLCVGTRNTDAQLDEIEAAIALAVATGELPEARLRDAEVRVRALAEAVPAVPFEAVAPPTFDLAPTIAAFDVRPGAVVPPDATLVALETTANIAVGVVPWGPAATGASVEVVGEGDPLPAGPLVLLGKDVARHDWTRALVGAARARDAATLVVDLGWPDPDRAYADVATFGASRHVGAALVAWLQDRGWRGRVEQER